jgi:undecaprenyl-diphosphatase
MIVDKTAPAVGRFVERELELCRRMSRLGRAHPGGGALAFFRFVSRAGDGACWFALVGALALVGGVESFGAILRMSAVGVLAALVSRATKVWVARPRPYTLEPRLFAGCEALDRWSFPSGHTLHAVAFNAVLIPDHPTLALALVPWTAAIALSRVVLGLHYPSDVAGGAAIGGLLAAVVTLFA